MVGELTDGHSPSNTTNTLNHPVKRRSPHSPKKQESTTAVLPPVATATVEAVAAVQVPASAQAIIHSVPAAASVPAASAVSISTLVRFDLSEFFYTNLYLLCSVFIPFCIYQLV